MKSPTTRAFACLLLFYALHPLPGSACAVMTKEEAARKHQQRIEKSKAEAIALRDEADQVFTGTMSQLSISQETSRDSAGREVVLQAHQAVFDFVDNIKGEYAKGQVLVSTINKNLIYVTDCGGRPFRSSLPKENGAGERYLVYARDGKILRTNHLPDNVQPLTGYEEAHLLRTAPE